MDISKFSRDCLERHVAIVSHTEVQHVLPSLYGLYKASKLLRLETHLFSFFGPIWLFQNFGLPSPALDAVSYHRKFKDVVSDSSCRQGGI